MFIKSNKYNVAFEQEHDGTQLNENHGGIS